MNEKIQQTLEMTHEVLTDAMEGGKELLAPLAAVLTVTY